LQGTNIKWFLSSTQSQSPQPSPVAISSKVFLCSLITAAVQYQGSSSQPMGSAPVNCIFPLTTCMQILW